MGESRFTGFVGPGCHSRALLSRALSQLDLVPPTEKRQRQSRRRKSWFTKK